MWDHIICVLLISGTFVFELKSQPLDDEFILQKIINASYDRRVRPIIRDDQGKSGPVDVEVSLLFRRMSNFDFISMTYDLQMTFREKWRDPRLAYNHIEGGELPAFVLLNERNSIWRPDTHFPEEIRSHRHDIDTPNTLYRISPDGSVTYSDRLSLTLSCPMDLAMFPFDKHECHFDLHSYAAGHELRYAWNSDHAVQIKENFMAALPTFSFDELFTSVYLSITNTGEYSFLRAKLTLARQSRYYFLQLYNPSAMLVIATWVAFWLDPAAINARLALALTSLLTMFIQSAVINNQLPHVNYVRAIDVWIGTCFAFIFAALIEYVIVNRVTNEENEKKGNISHENETLLEHSNKTNKSKKIDMYSKIVFPVAFAVFCVFYWITYCL